MLERACYFTEPTAGALGVISDHPRLGRKSSAQNTYLSLIAVVLRVQILKGI